MMPASSLPSLPPIHPGDRSVGPGGLPPAPHVRAPLPCSTSWSPRPSDLRSQAAHSGSYRAPRSEAMAVGRPDWRNPPLPVSQGSECLCLGQPDTIPAERLFPSGPPCRPRAPSLSITCQLPSGSTPSPENWPHGHQPPPSLPGVLCL